jgi:hypothetical protein
MESVMYASTPFTDGCISLMLARLYYYQGTSDKRSDNNDKEINGMLRKPTFSELV